MLTKLETAKESTKKLCEALEKLGDKDQSKKMENMGNPEVVLPVLGMFWKHATWTFLPFSASMYHFQQQ